MPNPSILRYFSKATVEEAAEQQKRRWDSLHEESALYRETLRIEAEKKSIKQAEKIREGNRKRQKNFCDRHQSASKASESYYLQNQKMKVHSLHLLTIYSD